MAGGGALQEVFARFGVQFDQGPLVQGQTATNDMTTALRTLGNVVAGSALVYGIRSFASEMVALGDDLETQAQLIGISTRELQEWHHVAALADVGAQEFDSSVLRLQNNMAQGTDQVAGVFRRLGVSMRDANGDLRDVSDVLTDLADPISNLSNDTERTGVLVTLLGRTGARLGPLFQQGSEGIRAAREELEALGGGASEEFIAQASAADDALHRWDVSWLSLRSRLAVYVIPIFTLVTQGLGRLATGIANAAEHSHLLQAAFVVLGVAGATAGHATTLAWLRAAAPFVALSALVIGLILVVDDLWTGLSGGESVLLDLGIAFEAWSDGLVGEDGIFRGIGLAIEYVKGLAISFVSTVWDMVNAIGSLLGAGEEIAGFNPLGNLTENIGQEQTPEAQAAQQISDRNRARFGAAEFLIPDSFERFIAVDEARRATATGPSATARAGAPPTTVTQTVRIDRIDATGLTPAQTGELVETHVRRALSAQHDETIDALAGGVS